MKEKEITKLFEILGEIWRDVTLVEFLMRCALARRKGDIAKFPMPPYKKGRIYKEYPDSFSLRYFRDVVDSFNKEFPELAIPKELVELRNAMAHGLTAEINKSGVNELIKFKENKETLEIEFSMSLDLDKMQKIRKHLRDLRRHISIQARD